MTPDSTKRNYDPQYLRELLALAGLTQRGAAEIMGIPERTFRDYLNGNSSSKAPYTVQFSLECLAQSA